MSGTGIGFTAGYMRVLNSARDFNAHWLPWVRHRENVFATFSQWWQGNRKNVEPVLQVGAKFASPYHRRQIAIFGRNQSDVHLGS